MVMQIRRLMVVVLVQMGACGGVMGEAYLTLGPMLGHVSSSDARVWVAASEACEVRVKIGKKGDLSDGRLSEVVKLEADSGLMGTILVEGLKPSTRYYYTVMVDGEEGMLRPYASFETPVRAGEPSRMRVAFTSCFGRSGKMATAGWAQMAGNANADVILMLGDNHYGDTTETGRLRSFYYSQRATAGFRAATRGTASYGIWDDHDYGPNDSDRTAKGKENSLKVFKEHWGNPSYGEKDNDGIYTTWVRGQVQFVLLDSRYHRDPNGQKDSAEKTLLGVKQKAWLKKVLKESKAKIKLVSLGSEFQLNGHKDSFSSFKFEQKAFFDFLRDEQIEGVILLSGDRHFTGAYQIRGEVIEVTSGPLGSRNFPTKNLPDMFMNYGEGKMYCVLDIDTRKQETVVKLEVHRAGDGVIYERVLTMDEINGKVRIKSR